MESVIGIAWNMQVRESVKKKTWSSYTNSDQHLRAYFGEIPILSIDAQSCREFRRSRQSKDGASPNSVNQTA